MDKLKQQLDPVLKFAFWIGSILVLIGAVAVWYLSTTDLDAKRTTNTGKINNQISQISSIRGEMDTHPNERSHSRMDELIASRQSEVLSSWKKLYERQQPLFTWSRDKLGDFVDNYVGKMPIEVHYEFSPTEDPLAETTRQIYASYIKNVLPDIAEIAKAEWTAEFDSQGPSGGGLGIGGGMGMGDMGMNGMGMNGVGMNGANGTGLDDGPIVQWSDASQKNTLTDLFPWRGRTPSTLEIYYSQENIWILEQLLGIVAEVNGDVTQSYQADIKEVKKIAIGKSVKFTSGNIDKPGALGGAMGGMGGLGGMGGDMSGMSMGGGPGGMGGGPMGMDGSDGGSATKTDPADDRYVNIKLEPIKASALRSALTSEKPSDVEVAVAKRVPVMLSVLINQRAVPRLLATCGSAPLMVEVRQVRSLKPSGASSTMQGGGGGMGLGDGGMSMGGMGMGGMGGMGMGGMGGMGGGGATSTSAAEDTTEMTVEIYGLIYLYNKPDPKKLGVEQVTAETDLGGEGEIIAKEGDAAADEGPAAASDGTLPGPAGDSAPAADEGTVGDGSTDADNAGDNLPAGGNVPAGTGGDGAPAADAGAAGPATGGPATGGDASNSGGDGAAADSGAAGSPPAGDASLGSGSGARDLAGNNP